MCWRHRAQKNAEEGVPAYLPHECIPDFQLPGICVHKDELLEERFSEALFLSQNSTFVIFTSLPDGKTLGRSQNELPPSGTPHAKALVGPVGIGARVQKEAMGGAKISNIVMIPANGAIMEPSSIESVSGSAIVAECPFLMWGGNVEVSMIAGMNLVGIVGVVLIVLVVNSRNAR